MIKNRFLKIISVISIFCIFLSVTLSNNLITANANTNKGSLALNTMAFVSVAPGDTSIYTINIPSTGVLTIHGDFDDKNDQNIILLNSNGNEMIRDSGRWQENSLTGKNNLVMSTQITSGLYYLKVENNSNDNAYYASFQIKFTSIKSISPKGTFKLNVLRTEDAVYQTRLEATGYFVITGTFDDPYDQSIEVYNVEGVRVDDDDAPDDWKQNNASGRYALKFKTKALKKGTYYIKIINQSNSSLSSDMKVVKKIPATKIKLSKTKLSLKKGKSYKFKATVTPKQSTDKLTWKSSNKKIVTVNSKGLVKAKKKGIAYITVKSESGVSKKCKIVVK